MFELKLCNVEKEDDQLILSILSKLGVDYLVSVSTFHLVNLTTPNWRMPTLISIFESLTQEHDKLIQMAGIIWSSKYQSLVARGPKLENDKGKQKDESPVEKDPMFLLWKGISSRKLLYEKNNWWDGYSSKET